KTRSSAEALSMPMICQRASGAIPKAEPTLNKARRVRIIGWAKPPKGKQERKLDTRLLAQMERLPKGSPALNLCERGRDQGFGKSLGLSERVRRKARTSAR